MWMLHFLSHLKDPTRASGRTPGSFMATGELSNSETARLAVRRALVEGGLWIASSRSPASFCPSSGPTRTRLRDRRSV